MIKIAAFDLDGTLAPSKLPVNMDMAELLQKLASHIKVVVISGQPFKNFEEKVLSPWLQKSPSMEMNKNLIILPEDGAKSFEFKEDLPAQAGKWVMTYEHPFNKELKILVMKALKDIIQSGKFDIPPDSERVGEYIEDRGSEINFSAYGQEAPLDKKAKWDPSRQKRMKIKHELDKIIGETCEVSVAGTTSLDILPKGQNKAAGLKHLLHRLDIDSKKMIFVGDSVFPGGNDYSPLEAGIKTIKITGPDATEVLIKNLIKTFEIIK